MTTTKNNNNATLVQEAILKSIEENGYFIDSEESSDVISEIREHLNEDIDNDEIFNAFIEVKDNEALNHLHIVKMRDGDNLDIAYVKDTEGFVNNYVRAFTDDVLSFFKNNCECSSEFIKEYLHEATCEVKYCDNSEIEDDGEETTVFTFCCVFDEVLKYYYTIQNNDLDDGDDIWQCINYANHSYITFDNQEFKTYEEVLEYLLARISLIAS